MSKHFALSTIKHDGRRYFRGDMLPELTREQLAALSGAASEDRPAEKEAAPEPAPEPVASNEPVDATGDDESDTLSDPDTGETEPVADRPAEKEAKGRAKK